MTTEQMRMYISKTYPGKKWQKRVANMPPRQVLAIYRRFQKDGVRVH